MNQSFRFSLDRRLGLLTPFHFRDFKHYGNQLKEIVDSREIPAKAEVSVGFPIKERIPYEDFCEADWNKNGIITLSLSSSTPTYFVIWLSHNKHWRDRGRLFFEGQCIDEETLEKVERAFKKGGISYTLGDGWEKDPYVWKASGRQSLGVLADHGVPVPGDIQRHFY